MWAVKKIKNKYSNKSAGGGQASGGASGGGGADLSLDIAAPVVNDLIWVPDAEKVIMGIKHSNQPTHCWSYSAADTGDSFFS